MINLLLGECTANPSYSYLDLVFVKNFLEQELGFAVLIVLITTCLGKDDWKAELSQLQLLVVAAVVLYKPHGSCMNVKVEELFTYISSTKCSSTWTRGVNN